MKIDDFLKPKKVRCIIGSSSSCNSCLTAGKLYEVIGATYGRLKIQNDNRGYSWHDMDCFELVIESAENPLQGVELTPDFEAVEPVLVDSRQVNIQDIGTDILDTNADIKDTPKFKVGDPVYLPNQAGGKILKIQDNKACHYPFFVDVVNSVNNSLYEIDRNGKTKYGNFTDVAIKATPENYEMLCKLYPHIKFEAPPKPLTGSDLARAMLDKGWKYVPCYISDSSDTHALERQTRTIAVITGTHKDYPSFFIYGSGKSFISYAVPFDFKKGEPLTQAVLDE